MGTEGFGPRVVFNLPGGIPVTETVTVTWFIMAVLIAAAYWMTRNMQAVPRGKQLVAETMVSSINGLVKQTMGPDKMGFAAYMGTLLMFLAIANIAGLFGLRPPTADVNTTVSLAIMTFIMTQFFGSKAKGIGGYLKGFLEPIPFLLPLNILGELANPVSLGFRLFGNIVGGLIIMSLLYGMLGGFTEMLFGIGIPILQVGVPAVMHVYFDLFAGLLQSFIFTMLTMVFVAMAMD